jgi:hypothetical protein
MQKLDIEVTIPERRIPTTRNKRTLVLSLFLRIIFKNEALAFCRLFLEA